MQWAPNAVLTAFRAVTQLASHWVTWDIQFLWRELCLVSNHVETGCFCRQWFPFSFSPLVRGLKDVQVHLKPAWTSAEVCLKKRKKKKKMWIAAGSDQRNWMGSFGETCWFFFLWPPQGWLCPASAELLVWAEPTINCHLPTALKMGIYHLPCGVWLGQLMDPFSPMLGLGINT